MSDLRVHELKCRSDYFEAVERGDKPFELRRADRDFQNGDYLVLRKYDDGYLDDIEVVRVIFVLRKHAGLAPDFVLLGIERVNGADDVHVMYHWQRYGGIAPMVRA